jgi:hypothetical protein
MRSFWLICACLAVALAPAAAQSGGFDRPTAGFVFRAGSGAVRPLVGVPGATYLGGPVLTGLRAAWIAPGGNWAFIITADHAAFVRGLSENAPSESPADGLIGAVDRVAWSRDGSVAVLCSTSGAQLQRVALANGRVSADDPLDLTPWGAPTALAVDPSGRRIAFGVDGAGIYLTDGTKPPTLLVSLPRPAATAFSDAGRLYTVDADTGRILEFTPDLSPADFAVVDAVDGVEFKPVGLAISGGGRYVILTDRGSRTVRVYETATRTLAETIQLDLAPAHTDRLSTGATYLLNRPHGAEWLLVLDASDMPRVYFVPAGDDVQ